MRCTTDPYRPHRIVARVLSLTTLAIASLVLAGWYLGIPALSSLVPGFSPMKVTTAIGFLCAAASVLMLNEITSESRVSQLTAKIMATVLGAAAGLLALGTTIGYTAGLVTETAHPAWMSPSTAASFLLFAAAVFTFGSEERRAQRLSESAILFMIWINGIVLIGYLYDEQSLYTFGLYVSTALPTALSFLLLGAALLCVRPDRGFMALLLSDEAGGLMLRRMVPLTFGMVIIIGWLKLAGEATGWFDRAFGMTAVVGLNIGGFSLVLWMVTRTLTQADRQRRESEIRLQLAKDAAALGIHDHDVAQGTIRWDGRVRELWGVGTDEPITIETFWSAVHPDDLSETKAAVNQALDPTGDGRYSAEFRVIHKRDGQTRWVEATGRAMFERDQAVRLVGTLQDITERKESEEALRESEARFRTLAEAAPVGIFRTNASGHCVYVNEWWMGIAGMTAEQALGNGWTERLHPDDRQMVFDRWMSAVKTHHAFSAEYRFVHPAGQVTWVLGHAVPEHGGGYVGITMDITERKHAEDKLRDSEQRLRFALTAGHLGSWQWDVRTGECIWNREHFEFLGLPPVADGKAHLDTFVNAVHSNDRLSVQLELERARQERRPYKPDFRVIRADNGDVRWMAGRGEYVFDEAGEAMYSYGVMFDITERKRAEAALRESEERFRMLADNMSQLAWIADATGSVKWYNKRWFDYTGTVFDEMRGWGWTKVHHPDHIDRVVAKIQWAWDVGEPWEDTFPLRGKDGQYRWFLSRAVPIHDANGNILQWFGTNTDVTEQRVAEESLRRLTDELESRVTERTRELEVSQARLRELASELSLAEQRERQRLATELHDHLQQMLVYGKMTIGQSKRRIADVPSAMEVIRKVDDVLSEALTYSRTLVAELSPPVLRDQGLAAGLTWLAEYMKKYNQTVTVLIPEQQELSLPEAHRVLLFQSVRELLINSSKHAGTGKATVRMEQREKQLHLTVSDEGKGFDVVAAASAGTPSSGISSKFGLFSIQERMLALGGSFIVRSAPGQGTTATLVLPVKQHADHRARNLVFPGASEVQTAVGSEGSPTPEKERGIVQVLLVDDHAMVRQGLRSVLDTYDDLHVVAEARDGQEAVKLVEDLQPHIVVMDINMPNMNGIEATRYIKIHWPETTVIGISVNAEDDNGTAMRRAGAAIVLPKESAVEQLHDAIIQAVGVSSNQ